MKSCFNLAYCVYWVTHHHGMTCVQVTGGAGGRQVKHTDVNFVSNQSRDTDKGWLYNINSKPQTRLTIVNARFHNNLLSSSATDSF
jgi:hypothetical protein